MTKNKKAILLVLAALLMGAPAWAGEPVTTQVEVTGAADVVSSSSRSRIYVTIKAHNANTDEVYCEEGTAVATTGFELGAGDGITWGSDVVPLDNSVSISCIAGGGTQRVSVSEHVK